MIKSEEILEQGGTGQCEKSRTTDVIRVITPNTKRKKQKKESKAEAEAKAKANAKAKAKAEAKAKAKAKQKQKRRRCRWARQTRERNRHVTSCHENHIMPIRIQSKLRYANN